MNHDGSGDDAVAGDVTGRSFVEDEVSHGVHLEAIDIVPVVKHFRAVVVVREGDGVELGAVGEDHTTFGEVILDGEFEFLELLIVGDEGTHPFTDDGVELFHGELDVTVTEDTSDEGDV